MPPLTIKEIAFVVFQLFSLALVIAGTFYRIKHLERECKQVKKTLYHEQGGLNVVSCSQCKSYRDDVFTAIRKGESKSEEQTRELKILNARIYRIMIHLKIDIEKDLV